jgi:transposase InsO family protein
VLKRDGVAISMDGRGRTLDNIFVERLWRNVKYEGIYLKGYANMAELTVSADHRQVWRALYKRHLLARNPTLPHKIHNTSWRIGHLLSRRV